MSQGVRLYAGTQQGLIVCRPKKGGWEKVSRAFEDAIIDSISGCRARPERVYAGVAHDGLYRTSDGGRSWSKVLDGDIRAVTVDPADDAVVYAGVEPVALFRSEDGGDRWRELKTLKDLPEAVRKNWWFPRPPHLGHVRHIFIHPDDAKVIYLCIEHGGVVRSFDRGETWEDVSQGIDYLDIHAIANFPGSFERYYLASARGFFTSADPARGWSRTEAGLTRNYFHDFVFFPPATPGEPPEMLLAAADGSPGVWRREQRGARAALFRSADGARSWTRVTRGLAENLDSMVWALARHPFDPRAVFAGFGNVARGHASGPGGAGDLMFSSDAGESWERLDIELPADRVLWAAGE
ncbi:MAG TPA: hypothetical protein VNN77_18280 [candidate division Zixibacteria bacterium]|nr:hypothetical protein [candidate division Zixibacteria bacterium]